MVKKPNIYVEISGDLFEPNVVARLHDAIAQGLEDLGDESAGIMASVISRGGFVKTGAFLTSIDSIGKRTSGPGYVSVAPTDVWPAPNRPTRTWAETGTRNGVKLRKGIGVFRNTAKQTQGMAYDRFFVDKIVEALS